MDPPPSRCGNLEVAPVVRPARFPMSEEQRSSGVPAVSTSAGKYNKVSLGPGLFPASTYVLVGPSRAERQTHTRTVKHTLKLTNGYPNESNLAVKSTV